MAKTKLSIKDVGKSFMVSERCYKLCASFFKTYKELVSTYPLETRQSLYDLCLNQLQSLKGKIK